MTTTAHSTGPKAASPVATSVEYDSVLQAMFVTIHGHKHLITVAEAQQIAEAICRESDSRLTAHPVDFDRAAVLIRAGRVADLAVA